MKNEQRTGYLLRDAIMSLLSDEEVARVSTAETAERLLDGDEYLDLEELSDGVRRVPTVRTPMGPVLPRSAVHRDTWKKVLSQLATPLPVDPELNGQLLTARNA